MPIASPILCLGTTPTVQQTMVFDRLATDHVNRSTNVLRSASGKPINVARVLHTLGQTHCLIIPLGGDTGSFIRADLTTAGIEHIAVPVVAPTRTCITVVDRSTHSATELVQEHEPLTSSETSAVLEALKSKIPNAKMLILSGSIAPGAGDDFYFRCCTIARQYSIPTIVDATGEALKRSLAAAPFIVKPNRQELAATMGCAVDDEKALRQAMLDLHHQGPQWIIVTLGRQGCIISDGNSFWNLPAPQVDAISPIGSGDAFTAGLASALTNGQSVPDACRLATAAAAANTLVPGAGFLRIHDVELIYSQLSK